MSTNTVTIRNRSTTPRDFPVCLTGVDTTKLTANQLAANIQHVTLSPGYTSGIPEEAYTAMLENPIFMSLVNERIVYKVEEDSLKIAGDKYGQVQVKNKVDGDQPLVDHEILQSKTKGYKPSIDFLMSFKGCGKATAVEILNGMPNNGWKNFGEMKSSLEGIKKFSNIDFSEIKS